MRYLELEALDGSTWAIPILAVAMSYQAHYGEEADDDALVDWARNDMNWADVKDHAVMTGKPDSLDMEDSWANGKLRIVEGKVQPVIAPEVLFPSEPALISMIRAASEPGDFPPSPVGHYACKRCGKTCTGGRSYRVQPWSVPDGIRIGRAARA